MNPERVVRGVLPVFQTPFRSDETIDPEALEAEIDWVFDQGCDGIVMAMVSELLRLSTTERDELAKLACQLGSGRGPVVISVGAESIHVAERHARHAQEVGADAVMAIPPISVAVDDEQLIRYFGRLAGSVDLPVIVQDASSYVGKAMSAELQRRLLEELGERVMFKPEADPIGARLSRLRDATHGRARVFEGSGGLHLIDSYRRGIVGTMPSADVCWAIVSLWKALEAGDDASAYAIAGPLALLVSLQTGLDGFVAVEKYLLNRQGVLSSSATRGPTAFELDRETAAELDRLLELLREAVRSCEPARS
jgi:dihydrodipicolinate synthase/N-acetylneuraminate lyase